MVGSVLFGTGVAPAAVSSFDGSATATGVRLVFFADKSPVTKTPIDGGGPVAGAILDSLGTSSALASNPYPGDLFLAGPGLLAGAFGVPALPPYPFIARADHPVTPEQSTSTPFGDFSASAKPEEAKASATSGGGSGDFAVGQALSQASVRVDGDTVISESQSIARAVRVGDLHIAGVHSSAKVVLHPDGSLERIATVAFDDPTVAGVPVAFTTSGVAPAPGVQPPAGFTPADQLNDAGIHVAQLSKEETDDGVVSAGLQITKTADFGPAGPGFIRLVFGQSSARARGEGTVLATPSDAAPSDAPPATSAADEVPLPSPATGQAGASPAVTDGGEPFGSTDVPLAGPVTAGARRASMAVSDLESLAAMAPAPVGNDVLAPAPSELQTIAAAAPPPMQADLAASQSNGLDLTPLYGVLILSAALALTAIQLVRFFAER